MGEYKANMLESPAMARRPERVQEDVLTTVELKELSEHLSRLSPQHVQDFYQRAYEECRIVYPHLPSPKAIQSLVQAWKLLRKWRR